MPKQPHPRIKILYFTEKIDELLAKPCLEQETEEQKLLNMNWRAKLGRYNYCLILWQNKLKQMYE